MEDSPRNSQPEDKDSTEEDQSYLDAAENHRKRDFLNRWLKLRHAESSPGNQHEDDDEEDDEAEESSTPRRYKRFFRRLFQSSVAVERQPEQPKHEDINSPEPESDTPELEEYVRREDIPTLGEAEPTEAGREQPDPTDDEDESELLIDHDIETQEPTPEPDIEDDQQPSPGPEPEEDVGRVVPEQARANNQEAIASATTMPEYTAAPQRGSQPEAVGKIIERSSSRAALGAFIGAEFLSRRRDKKLRRELDRVKKTSKKNQQQIKAIETKPPETKPRSETPYSSVSRETTVAATGEKLPKKPVSAPEKTTLNNPAPRVETIGLRPEAESVKNFNNLEIVQNIEAAKVANLTEKVFDTRHEVMGNEDTSKVAAKTETMTAASTYQPQNDQGWTPGPTIDRQPAVESKTPSIYSSNSDDKSIYKQASVAGFWVAIGILLAILLFSQLR